MRQPRLQVEKITRMSAEAIEAERPTANLSEKEQRRRATDALRVHKRTIWARDNPEAAAAFAARKDAEATAAEAAAGVLSASGGAADWDVGGGTSLSQRGSSSPGARDCGSPNRSARFYALAAEEKDVGGGLVVRQLQDSDYNAGFVALLGQLTTVGKLDK